MVIYAIFLCLQITQACRPVDPSQTYADLATCQSELLKWYGGGWQGQLPKLDSRGRYMIESGTWYECLRRHVDSWESQ